MATNAAAIGVWTTYEGYTFGAAVTSRLFEDVGTVLLFAANDCWLLDIMDWRAHCCVAVIHAVNR